MTESRPVPAEAAPTEAHPDRRARARARVFAVPLGLAAAAAVILLAFGWPAVTSEPRDLPLVVAGPADRVAPLESALAERAGDLFDITAVDDRDAAVAAIETRAAYGAIVVGGQPGAVEVLTASAASPVVAQQLGSIAGALQAQLQAVVAAQVPAGMEPPTVEVTVSDVVPLAEADPRGAGLASAAFPLVIGGLLGGIAVSFLVAGAWRRLAALAIYAVTASVAFAAILQGWFGVLPGDTLATTGAIALALLAIGAPIVGLVSLLGRVGIPLGVITFLLVANPISSATQPVEFLPAPWGAVGQAFPPGAGASLLRSVSYFPDASTTVPWLVLAAWAVGGVALLAVAAVRDAGRVRRAG